MLLHAHFLVVACCSALCVDWIRDEMRDRQTEIDRDKHGQREIETEREVRDEETTRGQEGGREER